jgi:16S rRNA (adenine1518-N6/adenine1519-N6)-dimethyltransferase
VHRKNVRKRRSLGQHYLVDRSAIDLIVKVAGIKRGERVLEIGTGKGVLTGELCKLSAHVEAYELDEVNFLATKGLGIRGLELHLGDAFAARPEFDALVSSLPYSESSNFVEWLSQSDYDRAVVVLQKDFVEKLLAVPGDERYRAVSVISQLSSVTNFVKEVGRDSFSPQPKVLSAIVEMRPRAKLSPHQIRLIKLLFSQRRRKLSVALKKLDLKPGPIGADLLARRVESLSSLEFEGFLGLSEENLQISYND